MSQRTCRSVRCLVDACTTAERFWMYHVQDLDSMERANEKFGGICCMQSREDSLANLGTRVPLSVHRYPEPNAHYALFNNIPFIHLSDFSTRGLLSTVDGERFNTKDDIDMGIAESGCTRFTTKNLSNFRQVFGWHAREAASMQGDGSSRIVLLVLSKQVKVKSVR
jgi:hypothetical protein